MFGIGREPTSRIQTLDGGSGKLRCRRHRMMAHGPGFARSHDAMSSLTATRASNAANGGSLSLWYRPERTAMCRCSRGWTVVVRATGTSQGGPRPWDTLMDDSTHRSIPPTSVTRMNKLLISYLHVTCVWQCIIHHSVISNAKINHLLCFSKIEY